VLVFWRDGVLQIEPESEVERSALVALVENAKFGRPQGKVIPAGSSELGSDELFKALVGDHQTRPGSFASKAEHNQPVVSIDKAV